MLALPGGVVASLSQDGFLAVQPGSTATIGPPSVIVEERKPGRRPRKYPPPGGGTDILEECK